MQRLRPASGGFSGTAFQEPGPRLRTIANGTTGLIAIGASTGGTEAIRSVLEHVPANAPPIVIVQHIPPVFSKAFAERLDQLCAVKVKEAVDGDSVRAGTAIVAPGDFHLTVTDSARGIIVRLTKGEKVCYQRPSVDVMFESVAAVYGRNALGIILTGMGNDGAAGLLRLRRTEREPSRRTRQAVLCTECPNRLCWWVRLSEYCRSRKSAEQSAISRQHRKSALLLSLAERNAHAILTLTVEARPPSVAGSEFPGSSGSAVKGVFRRNRTRK